MNMTQERSDGVLKVVTASARFVEGMKPVFEICEGLQKAMQPFADLRRQIQAIRVPSLELREHESAVRRLVDGQRRFADAVGKRNLGPLLTAAGKLARHARNAQALDDAGWLPHYSTPFDRCNECGGDLDALYEFLSGHYRERWTEIRRDIEARLMQYDVDDEAKATFREALDAHEAGLYRSVCRVLMPELERVSRRELHGDGMEPITSQKLLQELTAQLHMSSVEPAGFYNLNLFRRLSKHLYEHLSDEEDRQRFERDPVPNRHAAVHGLVVYSSMQNSLNTLFMAEYIFQVIGVLKGLLSEQAPSDAEAQVGA